MSTSQVQPIANDFPITPKASAYRGIPDAPVKRKEFALSADGLARALGSRRGGNRNRYKDAEGTKLIEALKNTLESVDEKLGKCEARIKHAGVLEGFDDVSYEVTAKVNAISSVRELVKRYQSAIRTWTSLSVQLHPPHKGEVQDAGGLKPKLDELQEEVDQLYRDINTLVMSTQPSEGRQGIRMQSLSNLDRDVFVDPRLALPSRYQRVHACEDELRKMLEDANEGRVAYSEDDLI